VQRKTKIKPPRGGGQKVGQLATRSPHRPNPLGLSLVKLDAVDTTGKLLRISALDMVNGTPVYDIKPCVPWDIPGYRIPVVVPPCMKVPPWVSQTDDAMLGVIFAEDAMRDLKSMVLQGRIAPLYTESNDGMEAAKRTLCEVLLHDPRASHKRGSNTSVNEQSYSLIFGNSQVDFRCKDGEVAVLNIRAVDFEEESYVDGIPLIST